MGRLTPSRKQPVLSKKKKTNKKLSRFGWLNRQQRMLLVVFALSFAGFGSFFLYKSFAQTHDFTTFAFQSRTALHQTTNDATWEFGVGKYDGDSNADVYAIKKNGGSGKTEVHILGSSNNFQGFSNQVATGLHPTADNPNWKFAIGDYDGDGRGDVYAIQKAGGSGKTEVHILGSRSNFQNFALQIATVLGPTTNDENWQFATGEYDGDGKADVYAIRKSGGSGKTEVHVLSSKTNFQSFALQTATALHPTTNDINWKFAIGDYDGDGRGDVYAIKKNGGSGKTEVHILGSRNNYQRFAFQIASALHQTSNDANWQFAVGNYGGGAKNEVYSIKKNGGSGTTEVHILRATNPAPAPAKSSSGSTGSSTKQQSSSSNKLNITKCNVSGTVQPNSNVAVTFDGPTRSDTVVYTKSAASGWFNVGYSGNEQLPARVHVNNVYVGSGTVGPAC